MIITNYEKYCIYGNFNTTNENLSKNAKIAKNRLEQHYGGGTKFQNNEVIILKIDNYYNACLIKEKNPLEIFKTVIPFDEKFIYTPTIIEYKLTYLFKERKTKLTY